MDDHSFMHFSWSPKRDPESSYDEMIEHDEIDDLNDMIEEHVEGYQEVNILEETSDNDDATYYIHENIIPEKYDTQEIYQLHDDGIMGKTARIGVGMSHLIEQRVQEAENKIIGDQDAQEEFTAEVITEEDWVQSQGEEIVPVAMEQIVTSGDYQDDDIDAVPLQTGQDEYTTQRPYPCDFCSRRFRKKANLINHMVAHQNVRPHMCNLCGSRYVRKCDLINHLKIHAYNIEDEQMAGPSTSGKKKPTSKYDDDDLSFLDSAYDDVDLPDEDDFDYSHYSKPIIPSSSSKPSTKGKTMPKSAPSTSSSGMGLGGGKKKPPSNKKTSTVAKFEKLEKLSKEKPSYSNFKVSIDDGAEKEEKSSKKDEYIERFPITDARKPFVCQTCGVAFTREKALESHMKIHASNEPTFDCEVCGDTFFDNASLEEHLDLRHDYSARFKKTGGKTTSGKVPSRAHFDYDDSNSSEYNPDKNIDEIDEEDEDYDEDNLHACDKCSLTFKTAESLKRHIKLHFIKSEILSDGEEGTGSSNKKPGANLGCNVCGESFTEALDLLAHAEIHARFQPFKCLLCGETFFEENKIKMHLMELHRNEMTDSSCKLCGKQCRDQRSLIKHSWEHSRDRAHSCSKCGKTFHNKARLKRHISSHRNKSVVCEICHEEFSDGRQLMNHRHSHTKANQFPCTECGKTFGSRSSQQIHIRIHTGERPYKCRFCYKAFADGGTLRKHERIHTGEKPYCCLICNRAFNQRVVLREHIRSHHSAPDPQNGTTLTPYYCSLCGDLFAVSQDLTHHLIEHSDQSTAAKRVQPTGPRKYKRRRKLSEDVPSTSSSAIMEVKFTPRTKAIKQEPIDSPPTSPPNKKGLLTMSFSQFDAPKKIVEFELPDEIFETVSRDRKEQKKAPASILGGTSTRPRMIFTEKTRVPVFDGKRKSRTMIQKQILGGSKRNNNNNNKKSSSFTKSREFVMAKKRKENTQVEPEEEDGGNGSETCSNEDDPNEDVLKVLLKRERKLSEKFTVDLVNDLHEILRSPLKLSEKIIQDDEEEIEIDEEDILEGSPSSSVRRSVRQTPSRYGSNRKAENKRNHIVLDDDDDVLMLEEDIIVKEEEIFDGQTCQICGDTFESREQLLSHVPIHI